MSSLVRIRVRQLQAGGTCSTKRPTTAASFELPHPILTNDDMQRLRTVKRNDFKVAVLPALFPYSEDNPGQHLAEALAELVDAGERAIQDGASLLIVTDRDISPKHVAIPSLLATSALHHGLLERRLRSERASPWKAASPAK